MQCGACQIAGKTALIEKIPNTMSDTAADTNTRPNEPFRNWKGVNRPELPLNQIINSDCLPGLRALPANIVDCIVTSPPYWGQRGDPGIGSEEDPRDYVVNVTSILTECMRVLKPEGSLWLNIGDAYNTPINWRFEDHKYSTLGADGEGLDESNSAYTKVRGGRRAFIDPSSGWLQYGNLLALPYRIIIALSDKGFLFRGEVIWFKRKAMPEGRCRRPHRKHESIYLLTKTEKHSFTVSPPVPSVWDVSIDLNNTSHTSTFPIDLPRRCILASGASKGIALDPFMGSGTTAVAARELGWDYIGFELNPTNVATARERASRTQLKLSSLL